MQNPRVHPEKMIDVISARDLPIRVDTCANLCQASTMPTIYVFFIEVLTFLIESILAITMKVHAIVTEYVSECKFEKRRIPRAVGT